MGDPLRLFIANQPGIAPAPAPAPAAAPAAITATVPLGNKLGPDGKKPKVRNTIFFSGSNDGLAGTRVQNGGEWDERVQSHGLCER